MTRDLSQTTYTELELAGAGIAHTTIEIQISWTVQPGSNGTYDEAPYGPTAVDIEVTGWRTKSSDPWVKPDGTLSKLLDGLIDEDWLMSQAEHPDEDDRE
jgi:hypothetical protein